MAGQNDGMRRINWKLTALSTAAALVATFVAGRVIKPRLQARRSWSATPATTGTAGGPIGGTTDRPAGNPRPTP